MNDKDIIKTQETIIKIQEQMFTEHMKCISNHSLILAKQRKESGNMIKGG